MTQATPTPITEYVRLSRDAYADLARSLPPIHVSRETTDLQAGYQLGVQAVLAVLREGFVVGR